MKLHVLGESQPYIANQLLSRHRAALESAVRLDPEMSIV